MRRTEHPHHTDEQVSAAIEKALLLVVVLEPDDDLRAAVFSEACRLYASKQIFWEQPAAVPILGMNHRPPGG